MWCSLPDHEKAAAQVISHYTGRLSDLDPDLALYAEYYLDPASDVQQAAKLLFKAKLDRMSEEQLADVLAEAQAEQAEASGQALTIIGGIALHRYQSVNPE